MKTYQLARSVFRDRWNCSVCHAQDISENPGRSKRACAGGSGHSGLFSFFALVTKRSVLTERLEHPRFEKPKVRNREKETKSAQETKESKEASESEASQIIEDVDAPALTESERK
jgi:hypothetical protein